MQRSDHDSPPVIDVTRTGPRSLTATRESVRRLRDLVDSGALHDGDTVRLRTLDGTVERVALFHPRAYAAHVHATARRPSEIREIRRLGTQARRQAHDHLMRIVDDARADLGLPSRAEENLASFSAAARAVADAAAATVEKVQAAFRSAAVPAAYVLADVFGDALETPLHFTPTYTPTPLFDAVAQAHGEG